MNSMQRLAVGVALLIVSGGAISYGAGIAWGTGAAFIAGGIYTAICGFVVLGVDS